jgi:CRP-like cAMP-binding protein
MSYHPFVRESDLGLCLFLIENGTVKQMMGGDKDGQLFDTLKEGSMFGEAPVVLNSEQFVTSVSVSSCDIW